MIVVVSHMLVRSYNICDFLVLIIWWMNGQEIFHFVGPCSPNSLSYKESGYPCPLYECVKWRHKAMAGYSQRNWDSTDPHRVLFHSVFCISCTLVCQAWACSCLKHTVQVWILTILFQSLSTNQKSILCFFVWCVVFWTETNPGAGLVGTCSVHGYPYLSST